MKGEGVNNSIDFIVRETAPIFEVKSGGVEETDKRLIKGTVVKGMLKTRIVNMDGSKLPYKFIQLSDKKGYISPQVVDMYIGDFANVDGTKQNKDTPTKSTSFGQKSSKIAKTKNLLVNYGLPIAGAYIGYKIAVKKGFENKKILGYVAFFGLLGCIPRYMYRKK